MKVLAIYAVNEHIKTAEVIDSGEFAHALAVSTHTASHASLVFLCIKPLLPGCNWKPRASRAPRGTLNDTAC